MNDHHLVLAIIVGFLGFFYIVLSKIGDDVGCDCHEEK
jgi:hypothetical protein